MVKQKKKHTSRFVFQSSSPQLTRSSRRTFLSLNSLDKKLGFTLIEMLVVAALIIVLTGLSFVSFRSTGQKSRNGKRQADISQVRAALELYRATNQSYPIYSAGSQALNFVNLIANASFRPFLSTTSIVDPTNTVPYQYWYRSSANGFTYSICYTSEPNGTQTCLTNP